MSNNPIISFLTNDTHGIPNWVWGGVVIGGLVAGSYLKNKFATPSTTTPASTYTPSGPPTDIGFINNPNPPTPLVQGDYTIGVGTVAGFSGPTVPAGTTGQAIATMHGVTLSQLNTVNALHGFLVNFGLPGGYNPNLPGALNGLQIWIPQGY